MIAFICPIMVIYLYVIRLKKREELFRKFLTVLQVMLHMAEVYEKEPTYRHHFTLSVHSPIRILSCLAAQPYIDLPVYSPTTHYPIASQVHECGAK
jgi:hypothetical protein